LAIDVQMERLRGRDAFSRPGPEGLGAGAAAFLCADGSLPQSALHPPPSPTPRKWESNLGPAPQGRRKRALDRLRGGEQEHQAGPAETIIRLRDCRQEAPAAPLGLCAAAGAPGGAPHKAGAARPGSVSGSWPTGRAAAKLAGAAAPPARATTIEGIASGASSRRLLQAGGPKAPREGRSRGFAGAAAGGSKDLIAAQSRPTQLFKRTRRRWRPLSEKALPDGQAQTPPASRSRAAHGAKASSKLGCSPSAQALSSSGPRAQAGSALVSAELRFQA